MTDSFISHDLIGDLANDFLACHRQGRKPSIESYAAAHPELADEIRRLFPALLMMEEIKPGSGDATGDFDAAAVVVRGARLERLGDFRVLREVGRGGMGVVYEAEQESLGRRVALKVLSAHAVPDSKQVKRFEREARAAARLHHTNIVPVFGVGEQDGLHYYVMQFIPGLGLESVIEEIKRLRAATATPPVAIGSPTECAKQDPGGAVPTAAGIARSLVTEQFTPGLAVGNDPGATEAARPERSGERALGPLAESAPPSSEVVLGPSGLSSATGSDARYWHSVARIGLQVACALEYAHSQGILHRDVKPANLLLDGQGNAWVTDFGLAKAVEGDDLTHTGDIVGTLRYMAPERFHGQCDGRADVYALGLTLYEMLALRPAFDQTARQALIRQVMEEEPARLRKLNPSIPRDLETVVQKAIAREPEGRYPTAGAMAEDLELFLDDKPVRARHTGGLERCWKWARRRPAIAALLAGLLITVVTGLTAVIWQWRAAVAARDDARKNLKTASKAVDTFFTTVSQEHLLNEPGMQPLREKLLKLSLPYYMSFAAQRSDNPALRADLAKAYLNWGTITGEIGSKEESKKILQTAASQFESLRRTDPTDLNVQLGLARSYQSLAQQSLQGAYGGDGFDEARRAAAVWAEVVKARPGDPEAPRMLGRCYDLAGVLQSGRDMDEARLYFQKAIQVLTDAEHHFPSDGEIRRRLAVANNNLATACRILGDLIGAELHIGKSLDILRKLHHDNPSSTLLQTDLARGLLNRGSGRQLAGSLRAAGDDLEEGLLLLKTVVERNPEVIDYRYLLSQAYSDLGSLSAEQKWTAAATRLFEKAILMQSDLSHLHPSMHQITLSLLGSHVTLATVERELGLVDLAKKTIGEALPNMKKYLAAIPDSENQATYFNTLLEWTMLESHPGGDTAVQVGPLLEGLREREDALQNRPIDIIIRSQAVTGYLAVGQLFAGSGTIADALQNFKKAADLLASGLGLAPDNRRLQSLKCRIETARGTALDRLGKADLAAAAMLQAVAIAEKLVGEDPSYFYDLACALALQTRLDPAAPGPPAAAVTALRKAMEFGFDNVYKLNNDEYLAPIRGRGDFQTLVHEMQNRSATSAGME